MKRYKILVLLIILGMPALLAAQPASWRGEWLGKFPDIDVRIFLRIDTSSTTAAKSALAKVASSTFVGDWASPNQRLPVVPVERLLITADSIRFLITGPTAFYDGKIDKTGDSIVGTWTQDGEETPLTLYRAYDYNAPLVPRGKNVKDTLHLTIAVTANPGQRFATLYSPDQSENLQPASEVVDSGGMLHLSFPKLYARVDATYSADSAKLDGIFHQGKDYPMSLVRSVLPIWKTEIEPIFTGLRDAVDTTFQGTITETFTYPPSGTSVTRRSWYRNDNVLVRMGDLTNEKRQRVTRINLRTHRISESFYGGHARPSLYDLSDSVQETAHEVLKPTGRTHVIRGKVCSEYYSVNNGEEDDEESTNLWWMTDDYPQSVKNGVLGSLLAYNVGRASLAMILRMKQLNMIPIEYQVISATGITMIATIDEVRAGKVEASVFKE